MKKQCIWTLNIKLGRGTIQYGFSGVCKTYNQKNDKIAVDSDGSRGEAHHRAAGAAV